MKGSEPPRIKVKPQNTNTMYKENKCFFSVSLENGITITGDNPDMVKSILSDLGLCIGDAIESGLNDNHTNWKAYITTLKHQLDEAWETIYNNQNKENNHENK